MGDKATLHNVSDPADFSGECHQILEEEVSLGAYKNIESFHNLKNNEMTITLILIPNKDRTKQSQNTNASISVVNLDAKIVHKILASEIPQHIKRIIHHNQVRFIVGVQGWLSIWTNINRIYHINW